MSSPGQVKGNVLNFRLFSVGHAGNFTARARKAGLLVSVSRDSRDSRVKRLYEASKTKDSRDSIEDTVSRDSRGHLESLDTRVSQL